MNGIINLLKPPGMSSAQAVSFVKRMTGAKVGHAGTLDPEAAGVLPLMVGRATKLFDYITEDHKVYLAEIAFGCATDTEDAQGVVTAESAHIPSVQQVKDVLASFYGTVMQRPPIYSALKRDGERLYALARKGIETETEERPVSIERIDYVAASSNTSHFIRVHCGKGTYIRSLCRDIGEKTGSRAHMRFLLREQVGGFAIADAFAPEEIAALVSDTPEAPACMHSPDRYLQHMPGIVIPGAFEKQVMNGVPIKAGDWAETKTENLALRAYMNDTFLGVAEIKEGMLSMKTLYALSLTSA